MKLNDILMVANRALEWHSMSSVHVSITMVCCTTETSNHRIVLDISAGGQSIQFGMSLDRERYQCQNSWINIDDIMSQSIQKRSDSAIRGSF